MLNLGKNELEDRAIVLRWRLELGPRSDPGSAVV
jgi:hypothetical protein